MHKLDLQELSNIGGHRLSVNDLFVLQESIKDVSKLVAELLAPIPATGLMVAGGTNYLHEATNFQIDAGWLHQGGELWRVIATPATVITPPSTGNLYFRLNKVPVFPTVVYQSGGTFQVHIENQALLEWHAAQPAAASGNYIVADDVSFDNIKTAFEPLQTGWTSIPTVDLPTLLRPDNDASKLDVNNSYYRYKKIGKTLFLQIKAKPIVAYTAASFDIYIEAISIPIQSELPNFVGYDDAGPTAPLHLIPVEYIDTPTKKFKATRTALSADSYISFQTFWELG